MKPYYTYDFLTEPLGFHRRKLSAKIIKNDMFFDQTVYGTVHKWQFDTDIKLRLNITFYFIHIHYMDLTKCFIGSLLINSYSLFQNSSQVFCGIYSNIICYPQHSKTEIIISSEYMTQYDINMFYSIIDTEIILEYATGNDRRQKPLWMVLFYTRQTVLEKFHIIISKLNYLELIVKHNFDLLLDVFDGPGILCIKLAFNGTRGYRNYRVSQFQTVFYIFYQLSSNLSFTTIDYLSKNVVFQNKTLNQSQDLMIYPGDKTETTSVMYFTVQVPFNERHINLTIINLYHNNNINPNCTYGGLTAYDTVDMLNEITVCNPVGKYLHRNIYSSGKYLNLVIYSYRKYIVLKIKFLLSSTKCKAISLNACFFTYSDLGPRFLDWSIIKYLAEFSSSDLVDIASDRRAYYVPVKALKCTVVQISHYTLLNRYVKCNNYYLKDMNYCPVRAITHEFPINIQDYKVEYTVSGFLTGEYDKFIYLMYIASICNSSVIRGPDIAGCLVI